MPQNFNGLNSCARGEATYFCACLARQVAVLHGQALIFPPFHLHLSQIPSAMRHEEKSKKDGRYADERSYYPNKSPHKKKKLKPVEKIKYRLKGYVDEEEE